MTELLIDGKLAALKRGTSFEYIVENRLFTDADAFSLSIELPMKNCPQNRAIYGYITRRDVMKNIQPKQAVLRSGTWSKTGVVTIVEVTEAEVKVQFLEGQSAANNASPLNDIYINEVDLPYPDEADATEEMCLKLAQEDIDDGQEYLALPWINEHSGIIQNRLSATAEAQTLVPTSRYFPYEVETLSYQIYLIPLVKKLLTEAGYSYDLAIWESSNWKYLMVFNCLPAAWQLKNFNRPLPHWSISELLSQIAGLMCVSITIDDAAKRVKMESIFGIIGNERTISNILDEYRETVGEEEVGFIGNRIGVYEDRGDERWRLLSCQEKIDNDLFEMIDDTYTYSQLWSVIKKQLITPYVMDIFEEIKNKQYNLIYKTTDTDEYYIRRQKLTRYSVYTMTDGTEYGYPTSMLGWIEQVNQFGNPYKGKSVSLKILPVKIADVTPMVDISLYERDASMHVAALDCGEIDEVYDIIVPPSFRSIEDVKRLQSMTEDVIYNEEKTVPEIFGLLYVGFWRKDFAHCIHNNGNSDALESNYNEVPITDRYGMPPSGLMSLWDQSVRNTQKKTSMTLSRKTVERFNMRVDAKEKLTVKWIDREIPNVTDVFMIDNKRYLCERIKTTFTEDGMSQLLEGDFYPLL